MFKALVIVLASVGSLALADGAAQKPAQPAPKLSSETISALEETFKKFKDSASFDLKVTKVTKLVFGEGKTYKGQIEVKGDRFRWENNEPTKSLMVFDGSILWNQESPPPGIKAPPLVTKKKLDKLGTDQPLFALLRRKQALSEQFKFEEVQPKEKSAYKFFKLIPKGREWSVKNLVATIDPVKKSLLGLRYEDDIGNQTFLQFSKVRLGSKIEDARFKYQPPAGAEVTEL